MCQPILSNKREDVTGRYMWKVVSKKDKSHGPFHSTEFGEDGWSIPVPPRTRRHRTRAGYHVFEEKWAALKYMATKWDSHRLKVQRVRVRGRGVRFRNAYGDGYAVEQWR